MRTFPGCWVLPGGMLDEGESFRQAAAREVNEETGLRVDEGALRAVAAWESSFPTTPEHCEEAGGIVSHVLMVCFVAPLESGVLRLQPDETDAAVWVQPDDLRDLLIAGGGPAPHTAAACTAPRTRGGRRRPSRLSESSQSRVTLCGRLG